MSWKKILILVLAIDVIVLIVLAAVFPRLAIPMEPREVMGIQSVFPRGEMKPIVSDNWQGYALPHRMRVLARSFGQAEDLWSLVLRGVPKMRLAEKVPIGDGGLYVVRRRSKGYVLYAVFRAGERVFWLDMVSTSTLDHAKRAFDDCLCKMNLAGKAIAVFLPGRLKEINRGISPFFIQSSDQLLLFLGILFTGIMAMIYALMSWAGACPPGKEGTVLLCTPRVTLVNKSFGSSSSACCLCLEGGRIVAYRFRRPFLAIDLRQAKSELVITKNRIRYQRYTLVFEEVDFQKWRMMLPA